MGLTPERVKKPALRTRMLYLDDANVRKNRLVKKTPWRMTLSSFTRMMTEMVSLFWRDMRIKK
jgi:hypothetical protein